MTELYRNIYLDGQRLHVPVTDGFTPQMGGAYPDTGAIVSDGFQSAMTAAAGGTLVVSSGVWLLDRTIYVPGNIVVQMHPGAILDWTLAPPGTIGLLAQGSLGPILPLAADSLQIGPSPIWVGSTDTTPANYVVDDRRSYQGISWRCVTSHTASNVQSYSTPSQALYNDAVTLGLWQRTSFKPTGGLGGIAPRDWLIVQDNARYDSQGWLNYRGEVVRVLATDATTGTITAQGTLHYDYLVSRNAFVRKLQPLENIRIHGGKLRFRNDIVPNNSIGILFDCCADVKVIGLEAENLLACVSLQDCIDFEGTACNFHDGHGLAYGWAVANNCQHIDLHHNVTTCMRHAVTISATPDRSGPMHVSYRDSFADCALRYTASATTPFGGTGDAIDTHPGCDYVTFSGNTILNASGSGIHVECAHSTVRNNSIDGAYYGMTIGNNTTVMGSADVTNNVVRGANGPGISIRSNARGASYAWINVQGNTVDDVGSAAYFIAGIDTNRLAGVSFLDNRARNSRSGAYMAYLTYCDAPEIGGYSAIQSIPSQQALGIFNFLGGRITSMTVSQPPGALATAVLISNINNFLIRSGRTTNVGNGTISQPDDPLRPGYQDGIYKVRCTTVAANGGTFTFYDIDGSALGTVAVGVAWDVYVAFTIADGSIDFALGDGWDFTVDGASSTTIKTANNVGGATLAVVTTTVVSDTMPEGTYLVTCTNATPPATWAVTYPDGSALGTATTGVPFSFNGLQFTITAAGNPSAVGDTFSVAGHRAAGGLQVSGVSLTSPSPGTNRGFFFGSAGTTKRIFWSADNDVDQAATVGTVNSGFGHIVESKARIEVRNENTSLTWTQLSRPTASVCSGPTVVLTGTITANRTMTLTTTNATDGATARFKVQNGVAGFSWSIGGLVSLIDAKWAQVTYSETLGAWVLTASG